MQRSCEAEPTCDLLLRGAIDLRVVGEHVHPIRFCTFRAAGEKKPLFAEEVRALRSGMIITLDICTASIQKRCYTQRLVELRERFQKFT